MTLRKQIRGGAGISIAIGSENEIGNDRAGGLQFRSRIRSALLRQGEYKSEYEVDMDAAHYLLAANAAVWIGLGGYIVFLARRQAMMEQRLQHLEALDNEQYDS